MTQVDTAIKPKQLSPGSRYDVELRDCCVEGSLIGTFLRLEFEDSDAEHEYPTAIFDFGSLAGQAWVATPVGGNPTPG